MGHLCRIWKSYETEKPPAGLFWWRVDASVMPKAWSGYNPEFVARMRLRGAGLENILSPDFDDWDGYRVNLPLGIQWAPVSGDEQEKEFHIPGLDVLACPFCGSPPYMKWHGRYICAPIFHPESFSIRCTGCGIPEIRLARNFGWMVKAWNTRPARTEGGE